MADIRIKDLTTTASSTASDDFFAADGTTNGTRKLSAYSPSFGGNATVGGTLTVSGFAKTSTHTTLGTSGSLVSFSASNNADSGLPTTWTGNYGLGIQYLGSSNNAFFIGDGTGGATYFYTRASSTNTTRLAIDNVTGNITIPSTTASTSTSSGALVVGNGTSGGLGVGGAIFAGGIVKAGLSTYAGAGLPSGVGSTFQIDVENATTRDLFAFGDSTRCGLLRGFHDGSGRAEWRFGRYQSSAFAEYVRITGITAADAVLSVYGTTASTGTSSGALVVSGGVGVAGAIVTGGIVRCGGSNGLSLGSDTGNIRIDTAGPAGVEFRGLSSADTVIGFTMREMALIDGTTAPSTRAGYATIYVDTADGDLKIKFGDGTVKTIATDS